MMKALWIAAALAASLAGKPAVAQAAEPVVVIVKVAKPWYAPQALVVSKMRDTVPQYEQLPGLAHKAFSFARADGRFGGIYFWRDQAAASAWFNAGWFERVRKERGVEGEVQILQSPVWFDATPEGAPRAMAGEAVATLVSWPVPAGTERSTLVSQLAAKVHAAQTAPGLLRQYGVITDNGRFGQLTLWASEASAREALGTSETASIEWFDTPILLPSARADNRIAPPQP